MYKPFLHKRATKYYKSLDDKTARRINKNNVVGLAIVG